MDTVHTLWNWVVCSILTAAVVVRAECPQDALKKAQMCTAHLGLGPPSVGPNRFVQSGEIEKAKVACSEGLFTKAVTCLRNLKDNCTGNREREHILRMMIDPDNSERSVNYFCKNINIYELNAKCIEDSHEEQANCTYDVVKNFKTKAMATVNMDVMMTSTCRFYHKAVSCSSKVIKRRCGQATVDIVMTIMKGFMPPKCLEVTFDEGTYTVSDDDNSATLSRDFSSMLYISVLLYQCTVLCTV